MIESNSILGRELHISPKLVLSFLAILSSFLVLAGVSASSSSYDPARIAFANLFYLLLVITWLAEDRMPRTMNWLTVGALVIFVFLGKNWLGISGFTALVPLPVILTGILVSIPAAAVTAIMETALIFALPNFMAMGSDPTTTWIIVISIWSGFGIMYVLHFEIQQLSIWLDNYYQNTHYLRDEIKQRNEEREQTLSGLTHANRQLALMNQKIGILRIMAEEAQKTKTMFLSKVSHEFRTPLNMIVGLVELMVNKADIDEDVPQHFLDDLKTVHQNCKHLAGMINDVLDLSQADTGRLTLHKERVNMGELIESALAVVRPLIESKGIDLKTKVLEEMPEVYCDRTRIRQVIFNLLSNAVKFTTDGFIAVESAVDGQRMTISVTDSGPGIAPEDANTIFEPFNQGSTQLWRDRGGSGLGLSISKQFVDLHGGQIRLESKLGEGSKFIFTLPISPALEPVKHPMQNIQEDWVWRESAFRSASVAATPQLSKPRVIIFDEAGGLWQRFSHAVDEIEFVEIRAFSQLFAALHDCPAHAVMINTGSIENLWPILDRIKAEAPHTPILGCCVPQQFSQALSLGAVNYLTKPVLQSDLNRAIHSLGRPVRKILVVDNDPDVLKLFRRMLLFYDPALDLLAADNGKEALKLLRDELPDLMLLDVIMPEMDGWQVVEEKKKDDKIRDIPVILISAGNPLDAPNSSPALFVTMDEGLSFNQLVRCSCEIPALLSRPIFHPDLGSTLPPGPAHLENPGGWQV